MPKPAEVGPLALTPGSIVLHIGVHKTGTTAIQSALANSRAELAALGIAYPGSLQAHRLVASSAMNRRLGWRVGGAPPPDPDMWNHFVDDAHNYSGITVCSSEFFAESSDEIAEGIIQRIGLGRVHVVLTLRNLARILPSAWQQILKSGYATGYELWLEQVFAAEVTEPKPQTFWNRHRHDQVVQRWAGLVGPENMTVIVVDDTDPDDIYRNFETLLGIPSDTLFNRRVESANRSMTLEEAEFLRHLNLSVGGGPGWKVYGNAAHDSLIKGMIERRRPAQLESRMLTPQWALDRAADLASTYVEAIRDSGVHVVGNLDVLSQRYQAPPTISDAEPTSMPISAAISAILGAMDGFRSSEDQSRPKRLKKRVKKLQVALRSKGRS